MYTAADMTIYIILLHGRMILPAYTMKKDTMTRTVRVMMT